MEKVVVDLTARSVVNHTSFDECAGLLNELQHLHYYRSVVSDGGQWVCLFQLCK